MYKQIGKQELHLSQKVNIKTPDWGKIEVSVLTYEFSRTHGTFKYATQILAPNELNQILKVGSVRQYSTEEEARQGHKEIIRKLNNGEFKFVTELQRMII